MRDLSRLSDREIVTRATEMARSLDAFGGITNPHRSLPLNTEQAAAEMMRELILRLIEHGTTADGTQGMRRGVR